MTSAHPTTHCHEAAMSHTGAQKSRLGFARMRAGIDSHVGIRRQKTSGRYKQPNNKKPNTQAQRGPRAGQYRMSRKIQYVQRARPNGRWKLIRALERVWQSQPGRAPCFFRQVFNPTNPPSNEPRRSQPAKAPQPAMLLPATLPPVAMATMATPIGAAAHVILYGRRSRL